MLAQCKWVVHEDLDLPSLVHTEAVHAATAQYLARPDKIHTATPTKCNARHALLAGKTISQGISLRSAHPVFQLPARLIHRCVPEHDAAVEGRRHVAIGNALQVLDNARGNVGEDLAALLELVQNRKVEQVDRLAGSDARQASVRTDCDVPHRVPVRRPANT